MPELLSTGTTKLYPAPREPLPYHHSKKSDECEIAKIAQVMYMYEGDDSESSLKPRAKRVRQEIGFKGEQLESGQDMLYLLRKGYEVREFVTPGSFDSRRFAEAGGDYFREYYRGRSDAFWEVYTEEQINRLERLQGALVNFASYSIAATTRDGIEAVAEVLEAGYVADLTFGRDADQAEAHNVLVTGYEPDSDALADGLRGKELLDEGWFDYYNPSNTRNELPVGNTPGVDLADNMMPQAGVVGIRKPL